MAALAVVLQRFVGHHRAEIGAADADVDHVADALAGVPLPLAAAHPVRESRHLVEHRMHLRHDILAVDKNRFALGCAQRHVQHGPVLGDVDLLAANMASMRSRSFDSSARASSSLSVSSVMRFFE